MYAAGFWAGSIRTASQHMLVGFFPLPVNHALVGFPVQCMLLERASKALYGCFTRLVSGGPDSTNWKASNFQGQ
jgi:hypothetical protein